VQAGKFEISPEAHVTDAFRPGGRFSLDAPVGSIDRPTLFGLYSDAIKARMEAHGFENVEIGIPDAHGFYVDAFNANGSTFSIGFSVNDRMGLDIDYATGISVANGNEINLHADHWDFTDDFDYDNLEAFLENFKDW
jgi:hypothetical protein